MTNSKQDSAGEKKKMGRKIVFFIIILLFVSLAAALTALYWGDEVMALFSPEKRELPALPPSSAPTELAGEKALLFFPAGRGLTTREIMLKGGLHPLEKAEAVIVEYLKGLEKGLEETRMLGLYRDRENTLYLDFSGEITNRFAGDAMDEFVLMKSLWETVSRNLPWVSDVRLLIESKEKDSIGGHLFILHGLKETVERGG